MHNETNHIVGLTDREMLVLLGDQMRRMEQSVERLMTMMEQRLAQGDRKFSELDTRLTTHDARHTATNTAINGIDRRLMDFGHALKEERTTRCDQYGTITTQLKQLTVVQEAQADELMTWKTRVQMFGWGLGSVWAFVTFVWPFLPTLLRLVNNGLP